MYKKRSDKASISLDMDNQWSYMKTHGDSEWNQFPSYLDTFVPHVLDLLDCLKIKITFFIVGQDAALEKNKAVLGELTRRGHEVGNHSFHHEVWMHRGTTDRIRDEILLAQDHIFKATGEIPVGYRGPGFTWSRNLLQVLAEAGFRYDASTLPTFLGPLARMYYFWKADLNSEQKKKRTDIYGDLKDGLKSTRQYYWQLNHGYQLLEIPVSTIPILKTPFHLSYLIYLSRFSELLMQYYLMLAICLCKLSRSEPSFLLHPLDLIGGDLLPGLDFFPGMDLSTNRKVYLFKKVLGILAKHYYLVTMGQHADHILANQKLQIRRRY
jgi:hypothetical protein